MPFSHRLSLGTIGLKSRDLPAFAFDEADVVVCIGYDMGEYPPEFWNPAGDKIIVHIDALPAEVDEHYIVETGVRGDIGEALDEIAERLEPRPAVAFKALRDAIVAERREHAHDEGFPIKPQKILADLRLALGDEDIVISDVGAHKMWTARMYQAERPNTCIISNGFASMGIALPGAIAAKLVHPARKVVALTGDAGFLMNSQEIETALRMATPIVVLIWTDAEYGLITWHQLRHFGRPSHTAFGNPDFVKFAESFGAKGYRIDSATALLPTLKQALADDTVSIIDCPVDYAENMALTRRLESLKPPA
jgi:acetolactate synthase-1/2/3 large subunit